MLGKKRYCPEADDVIDVNNMSSSRFFSKGTLSQNKDNPGKENRRKVARVLVTFSMKKKKVSLEQIIVESNDKLLYKISTKC